MIGLKAWDVTYVEYQRRGLETFPEEVPRAFDWMDRHRRDPYPKAFKVFAARPSDNRFYGVVVHNYATGHTTAPEAVELFGQNLNPAEIKMSSSSLSNLIRIDRKGVGSFDLWLSPKLIDFKRKPEIRINGRPYAARPQRPPQAGSRDDARRPPRPRRPATALLAQDFDRLVVSGQWSVVSFDVGRRCVRLVRLRWTAACPTRSTALYFH